MDAQNKKIAWLSVHDIQKEPILCSSVDFGNGPDRIWANSTDTWGNEKIASTIQNIVERKINAENNFQSSPTSEEILAGLRFQDVRNIYIENDCHLCSHYTSVSLPPYEHLNDGKNKIQSAYHEAADGRQRRLSGGSAWGDQEVRFNNPFDPRLRFDGLTPSSERKHVDSESRPVLDDMNSLIMTQDPVEFADTYYSKYRMYVNDLQNGGDLSSGGDVFGSRQPRSEVPPFVGDATDNMGLWQRIVSTKRFWSEDDDNNSKRTNRSVRQSLGMGDMAEIGSTSASSVAVDESAYGRSFKHLAGRPPSVSNDKKPYTEEKTITSQQEQRATGRSRKDIYDWLSGLQAGLDQKQTPTYMHKRTDEQHTPSQVRGIPQTGCYQPQATAPVEVRKIQILTKHSYPSRPSTTVGQEETSNDTLVSTPDSGKVFRSKPTTQTVATTFNTNMTSLKNVNTAYSSKAAGQDLNGRAIPVITGHSGIASGKGGTIIRAPPRSSLHATSAGLKSGEIKHDTQTTQSLETRETNNKTTSRATPAHQPQVMFSGPRSADFPSQTSMFWSHQQREADQHWEQDGRRQHKQDDHKTSYSDLYSNVADGADGNLRTPQPTSAATDQCGRATYTQFDQCGDKGERSCVYRLSNGNEQVHKQLAENNVKRDGNYEQEQQNLAKPTEQLLPFAGKWFGTQNTGATRPLSETWHYVFSQQQHSSDPQQVYQYDQSRPQDVKLDDEVWYINGVPFQHAKSLQIPFQYPNNVQSPSPPAFPVSAQYTSDHITSQYQWSAGNCDNTQDTTTQSQVFAQPPPQMPIVFDPARGYHVYQMNLPANDYTTRNNANYFNTTRGKKSQTNNSGYHLGVPIPSNQNNNSFLRDDGRVVTGDYRVEVVEQEPHIRSPCVSESPCESVDAHSSDRSSLHEPFASLESSSCLSSFGDFVDSSSPSPFEDVESVDVNTHGEGTLFLDCLNQFEQPATEPNLPIKSVCGDQCPELLSDVPFKAKKIRIIRNSSHAREQAIIAANKRKPTRNMRSGLITIL